MNGVVIAVMVILAGATAVGYWKGFVRIAFSLVSMILAMVLVSWVTPHVTTFIKENTQIYEELTELCVQKIQQSAEEKMEEETTEEKTIEEDSFLDSMPFPEEWKEEMRKQAGESVGQAIEESGLYQKAGEYIADLIIKGIAFLVAFLLVSVILKMALGVLDVITKLPLLNGMNCLLGATVGFLEGILIVWILMFVATIACTSQPGRLVLESIAENAFLTWVYQNNLILNLFQSMLLS